MPICEHASVGQSTYFAYSLHILPGQVFDFGVQVSQEHILCSLLVFLKIEGADKINTKMKRADEQALLNTDYTMNSTAIVRYSKTFTNSRLHK